MVQFCLAMIKELVLWFTHAKDGAPAYPSNASVALGTISISTPGRARSLPLLRKPAAPAPAPLAQHHLGTLHDYLHSA